MTGCVPAVLAAAVCPPVAVSTGSASLRLTDVSSRAVSNEVYIILQRMSSMR